MPPLRVLPLRVAAGVCREPAAAMPSRNLEKELDALRKRQQNKQCPNCAAEDRYGFKSACVKFE